MFSQVCTPRCPLLQACGDRKVTVNLPAGATARFLFKTFVMSPQVICSFGMHSYLMVRDVVQHELAIESEFPRRSSNFCLFCCLLGTIALSP